MSGMRVLHQLALADFRERIRSDGFLVTLGVTVFAAYLFVPPYGSPYATLVLGNHRGTYNSPWVGTLYGTVASVLLGLVGFYLVKSAVTRDYHTRVGQIIATTRTPKYLYMLGKWSSNVAVLATILAVLTVMAPTMQLVRGEDTEVRLGQLLAPIWLMGLPSLAIVAALAVLFESVSFLRGTLGNVVYFFLWGPVMLASEGPLLLARTPAVARNDVLGLSRSIVSVREQLAAGQIDWGHGVSGVISPLTAGDLTRFTWTGMEWTGPVVLERLGWVCVAVAVALLAALPFDRFDPARGRRMIASPTPYLDRMKTRIVARIGVSRGRPRAAGGRDASRAPAPAATPSAAVHLTPLGVANTASRWGGVLAAELRLMLKGHTWLWYSGAVVLLGAAVAVPLDVTHRYLLPAAWLWPLVIWSSMGSRECRWDTRQIVFSVAYPLRRQLSALWTAGFLVAALAGAGVLARLVAAGQWGAALGWCAGAVFIPSLALALGGWSGGTRLFEITYAAWWYLGPINGVAWLDFTGASAGAGNGTIPVAYVGAAVVLMALAWQGRRRQLHM